MFVINSAGVHVCMGPHVVVLLLLLLSLLCGCFGGGDDLRVLRGVSAVQVYILPSKIGTHKDWMDG